ncbi:hypothetical protein DIPPA_23709 [Diplonema papillatum]|nr:hypothetical protein DIPPA_23709 [Diplonema papillatum]|eukprot:gene8800-13635_t
MSTAAMPALTLAAAVLAVTLSFCSAECGQDCLDTCHDEGVCTVCYFFANGHFCTANCNAVCNEDSDCLIDRCSACRDGFCDHQEVQCNEACRFDGDCASFYCPYCVNGTCGSTVCGHQCLSSNDCYNSSCPWCNSTNVTNSGCSPSPNCGVPCTSNSTCIAAEGLCNDCVNGTCMNLTMNGTI